MQLTIGGAYILCAKYQTCYDLPQGSRACLMHQGDKSAKRRIDLGRAKAVAINGRLSRLHGAGKGARSWRRVFAPGVVDSCELPAPS
jgi:hypothetical protein